MTSPNQNPPQEDWITASIESALKKFSQNAAVIMEIKKQLNGRMSEQVIKGSDLIKVAEDLLAAMDEPSMEGKIAP